MKKMNKKGFTIVELVIVIAVIAILAAVLVPTFANVISNAKEAAAAQEAKSAYTATIVANSDDDTTNDVKLPTVNDGKYYVEVDGIKIVVTNGQAEVWEANEGDAFTANCKIEDGCLMDIAEGSEDAGEGEGGNADPNV